MKNLLLIALVLSFLAGNAQQAKPQVGQDCKKAPVQSYYGNHPELPIAWDIYMYADLKPDNLDLPYNINVYKNSIRKPDNLGQPVHFDRNRYSNRKTEHIGTPYHVNVNRYSNRKTD